MTISVQIELPKELNTKIEVYQAINKLQNKKVAIIQILETMVVKYDSKKGIKENEIFRNR